MGLKILICSICESYRLLFWLGSSLRGGLRGEKHAGLEHGLAASRRSAALLRDCWLCALLRYTTNLNVDQGLLLLLLLLLVDLVCRWLREV